jgi:hypothetical protein
VKLLVHVQSVLKRHLQKHAHQSQSVAVHVHHVPHALRSLHLKQPQQQLQQQKQHQLRKEALTNVDSSQG